MTARFPYAASKRGAPQAAVPVVPEALPEALPDEQELLAAITRMLVEAMEAAGQRFHHRQSMPSLEPGDYALATGGIRATSVRGILNQMAYTKACEVDVELLYIGEFGDEQRRQARELGGPRSVRTAKQEWERAREIVGA